MLLQQEAALQEALAQGQERERLLLDQHQQVCLLPLCAGVPFGFVPCMQSFLPSLTKSSKK